MAAIPREAALAHLTGTSSGGFTFALSCTVKHRILRIIYSIPTYGYLQARLAFGATAGYARTVIFCHQVDRYFFRLPSFHPFYPLPAPLFVARLLLLSDRPLLGWIIVRLWHGPPIQPLWCLRFTVASSWIYRRTRSRSHVGPPRSEARARLAHFDSARAEAAAALCAFGRGAAKEEDPWPSHRFILGSSWCCNTRRLGCGPWGRVRSWPPTIECWPRSAIIVIIIASINTIEVRRNSYPTDVLFTDRKANWVF